MADPEGLSIFSWSRALPPDANLHGIFRSADSTC
jgi:hypothetical protein